MNCCKPEQVGTKEYGKKLKRIQILEDGRSLPKRQETGRLKDERTELMKRNTEDCRMSLGWEDSWNKKVSGISQERNAAGRRCTALEEGDIVREYETMHKENFLGSWLMEDGKEKEENNNGNRRGRPGKR